MHARRTTPPTDRPSVDVTAPTAPTSPATAARHRGTGAPHGRRLLGAAALASVAVLLAGCAQDAGSSAPATGSDAMTLDVGQISNSAAFFPLFVAEQEGYFTDEGLTLGERPRLGTGAKLAAALQSGSIDVAAGVMTDAFNLYQVNDGTRVVGSLVDAYYVDVITATGFEGPGPDASLGDRVDALKGKTIGITGPGSGTEALVTYLFEQQGLDPATDATLVNLGGDPSAAVGALKAGRVDALSFFQPVAQQAEATGVGDLYISPARGDVPDLEGAMHGVVFTTSSVLDEKPDAVAAFLRAIGKAEETITGDEETTSTLLAEYQDTLAEGTVEALLPVLQDEIPSDPTPDQKGYEVSANFHEASGLVDSAPGFADMVPSDWISSALSGQ